MHGWLAAILNLLGMGGGGAAPVVPAVAVCGTFAVTDAVAGTFALADATGGTFALEEC